MLNAAHQGPQGHCLGHRLGHRASCSGRERARRVLSGLACLVPKMTGFRAVAAACPVASLSQIFYFWPETANVWPAYPRKPGCSAQAAPDLHAKTTRRLSRLPAVTQLSLVPGYHFTPSQQGQPDRRAPGSQPCACSCSGICVLCICVVCACVCRGVRFGAHVCAVSLSAHVCPM